MRRLICALLLALSLGPVQAHLMVAQKGTLNLVDDGAFLVLSVPVSAFEGVDDDGDGQLSLTELQAHTDAIEAQVRARVQLLGPTGALPLQGLMLSLSPPDTQPGGPARQLVVMGRFALSSARDGLTLQMNLFGREAGERQLDLSFTQGSRRQLARYTPEQALHPVLPGPKALLGDQLLSGASHVLEGLDHLLFLLVALSGGWGWRSLVLALTCFTVGHGLTLAAVLGLGLHVPSAWVEPAIAATIVGMLLFDARARHLRRPTPIAQRLALVFACSLVHGLGLAGAFDAAGLDGESLAWSLAGFNLGIEAAQLAVALAAFALWAALGRWPGPAITVQLSRLASMGALVVGLFWMVQRSWVAA